MGDRNINSQGYWDYKPNIHELGFPGGSAVKNLPANVGDTRDMGLIPGSGRFPGGENGNPLQCSCLENPTETIQAVYDLGIKRGLQKGKMA